MHEHVYPAPLTRQQLYSVVDRTNPFYPPGQPRSTTRVAEYYAHAKLATNCCYRSLCFNTAVGIDNDNFCEAKRDEHGILLF